MCGISGICYRSYQNTEISQRIVAVNNTLKHRGPDDEGYVIASSYGITPLYGDETIQFNGFKSLPYLPSKSVISYSQAAFLAFGHRRLSIVDTSISGHQPMCCPDGKTWIVYNGEIYNYIELKQVLKDKGFVFVSGTDTEVVLNAYLEWGEKCTDYFNGMWSFVIYDSDKKIIFGSRDRLGVKPLYYYLDNEKFVFASEQKAFLNCDGIQSGLNNRAVFDYLVLSHSQADKEGFFQGIIELKAGHNFFLNLNSFQFDTSCYFSIAKLNSDNGKLSFGYISSQLREVLEQSVSVRTRADVEIGSCLSGGIDSSVVVMLLNKFLGEKINTKKLKVFTAIYPGSEIDESKWAKCVVEKADLDWYCTEPNQFEMLRDLKDLLYYADSPMLTTSTYSQYKVMQLASQSGVKVLLDGQGADELFAGYDFFNVIYWNELLIKLRLLSLINEFLGSKRYFENLKKWILIDLKYLAFRLPKKLIIALYNSTIWEMKYIKDEFKIAYIERFGEVYYPFGNNLNKVLKEYSGGEKLQVLLRLEDRMSMRFSLESRTPFADDINLINLAFKIPSYMKISKGVQKKVLREATKNILPKEIYSRGDKIGFQTPEYDWLNTIQRNLVEIIQPNIDEFVDTKKLKDDMQKILKEPTSKLNSRLLRFIFLSQWRSVYSV